MTILSYHPDFSAECRLCGTSPTVLVANHPQPDTNLCGVCFFHLPEMVDWEKWPDNDQDLQEVN